MRLAEVIRQRIREEGPLPFATYAELALYHHEFGYYAGADRRSGGAGDFFTSVDLGPVFGEFLATQCAEMWRHLGTPRFDLVEAGAGSGRLARDLLDAARRLDPLFYDAIDLQLVERSPAARAAQTAELAGHLPKLASTGETLPPPGHLAGVVLANELLDALPPHVLVMTDDGLHEIYVDVEARGTFVERLGPVSSPRVRRHLDQFGIAPRLESGWRIEIVPNAVTWVRQAVDALDRGFVVLIDYGHEADELYSPAHAAGTLTTYARHRVDTVTPAGTPSWLMEPGSRDITTHVDLTAVRVTAEAAGATTLGVLDQTYFLLGLAEPAMLEPASNDRHAIRRRLALKTLLLPGGLGSTQKVMVFGKAVGAPTLAGLSYRVRAT